MPFSCLVDVDVPRNPQLVEKVPLDPRQPLRRGATPKKKKKPIISRPGYALAYQSKKSTVCVTSQMSKII